MKPKEGTILTVAKGAADKAAELSESVEDVEEFARLVLKKLIILRFHFYKPICHFSVPPF